MDYKKESMYIIATKDIKRYFLLNDDEPFKYEANLKDDSKFKMPRYIIAQLTDEGLVEYFNRILISSEDEKEDGLGIYFTTEDENTSKQILNDRDFAMCYDGNFDKKHLQEIDDTFYEFVSKAIYAKSNTEIEVVTTQKSMLN